MVMGGGAGIGTIRAVRGMVGHASPLSLHWYVNIALRISPHGPIPPLPASPCPPFSSISTCCSPLPPAAAGVVAPSFPVEMSDSMRDLTAAEALRRGGTL